MYSSREKKERVGDKSGKKENVLLLDRYQQKTFTEQCRLTLQVRIGLNL